MAIIVEVIATIAATLAGQAWDWSDGPHGINGTKDDIGNWK